MNFMAKIIIDEETKKSINKVLGLTGDESYNKYGLKEGEFFSHTVNFKNGNFADIKLVISIEDDINWTEMVLFDSEGYELAYTEVCEEYFGEWEIDYNGDIYKVEVL